MSDTGTFTNHPALAPLPPLVRKQRTIEAKLGDEKGSFQEQDKAVRKEIDALLRAAGLKQGELVTCNGYDVIERGQKGRTTVNVVTLLALLITAGLERDKAAMLIVQASETGEPSTWAEVNPSKGAKVRK